MTGAERIARERQRQIDEIGYDAKHDDEHHDGDIARAAACYAMPERLYVERRFRGQITFADPWPWDPRFDRRPEDKHGDPDPERTKREERIDLLTKAGALIAAEIDRLTRRKP
jgi:hypothetical protein